MSGAELRRAAPGDIVGLAALEAELFGADAWGERAVGEEVAGAGRTVLVAPGPDGPRGYVVVIAQGDVLDLARIGVRADQRRGGLATRLLTEALAVAAAGTPGADRVLLEVRADNDAALAFYARVGFGAVDTRRRYYRGGVDAVVMLMPLAGAGAGGEDGTHA